jgi:hypothetical protein
MPRRTRPERHCLSVDPENFKIGAHNARDRSTVDSELALRPEFLNPGPQATNGAACATRRGTGLSVLTAGPVQYLYGRYATRPVTAALADRTLGGSHTLFLPRDPNRGAEA